MYNHKINIIILKSEGVGLQWTHSFILELVIFDMINNTFAMTLLSAASFDTIVFHAHTNLPPTIPISLKKWSVIGKK